MSFQRLRLILIALITLTLLYFSLIITKSHLVEQYQRSYLSLSDNVTQIRERVYYFNHQDNQAHDKYAYQLVNTEIQALSLYENLKNERSVWIDSFLVSNNESILLARETYLNVSKLVTDLESLLRLNVSSEYTNHALLLLEKKLINELKNSDEKLFISQYILHGVTPKKPNTNLTEHSTFKNLSNYIKLRERINTERMSKEKTIFNNNIKRKLSTQNAYWLTQSEAIKSQLFITTLLFFFVMASYFYLRQRERLLQTLAIKKQLIDSEKEKSQLALVAEHAHDAILIMNDAGVVTWGNRSYYNLSGHDTEEIQGKNLGSILKNDRAENNDVLTINNALEMGKSINLELINYRKDGAEYWMDISITPITREDGKVQSFIAVERDISKHKELESKLIKSAETADVSNKAKSTFLATMSHELRTPLNGILGMAQIIESNIVDPEQHKQIQVLLESGEHLLSLLNDILDFSKIEQNKLELNNTSFHFKDVIDPIINTYSAICEDKGLELSIENNINREAIFNGDKPRIRQIIFNLISNAVKFTSKGSVTLSFSHTLTAKGEQGVQIKIQDTGIGIRKERLEHIFEPFIQAESTTTRQYGGTGLGLAIVKQLINAMNGCIHADSTENAGTIFTIVLPLETTIHKNTATTIKHDITATNNSREEEYGEKLSILIAEDNKINALVAQMFCQRLGHSVVIAENGKIAIEKLKYGQFDLIIMDNHMPVMDGIIATKTIRQELHLSTVIFACTADIFQEAHDSFLEAGANYILTKPLQENSFIDAIKQHQHLIKRHNTAEERKPTQIKNNIIELKRYSKEKRDSLPLTEAELDLSIIEQLCGNDHNTICEFLYSYVESSEEDITSLISAYDKEDIEAILLHSHSVKGMASHLEASRLTSSATAIEACTKKKIMPALNDIQQLINLLEVNIQQALRLIKQQNSYHESININK